MAIRTLSRHTTTAALVKRQSASTSSSPFGGLPRAVRAPPWRLARSAPNTRSNTATSCSPSTRRKHETPANTSPRSKPARPRHHRGSRRRSWRRMACTRCRVGCAARGPVAARGARGRRSSATRRRMATRRWPRGRQASARREVVVGVQMALRLVGEPIRYLTQPELERVIRDGVPPGTWTSTERTLYLTAAMTGLRQAELIGLRWRDIDWLGQRNPRPPDLRPRRVQGAEVAKGRPRCPAGDARRARTRSTLRSTSAFQSDDDLVFANPTTGGPLDRSKVYKRFQRARRAGNPCRAVPRPPSHLRDARRCVRRRCSARSGTDGAPRREDNADLRRWTPDPREATIVSDAFGE